MRAHPLIKKKDYHTMAYLFKGGRRVAVIMSYINEVEEKALDNKESINLNRGDRNFLLTRTNVIHYGEVDFNKGSDDYAVLEDSKLFFSLELSGVWVPANYDYENHLALSDINRPRWYDTVNAAIICRYGHGILNKPKRIVIFEQ